MPLRPIVTVAFVEELLFMVSWPVTEPVAVGSNCTLSVIVWPGLSVTGKVAPDTEKPAPVARAELTVTADVPVEVKVTGCVAGEFNTTLPKEMLFALMVNVGADVAFNCRLKLFERPLADAVRVTACVELTDETVAVRLAPVAPAGTVTDAGTPTALLLLERLTLTPPLGAALLSVTVQTSEPDPVIEALLQESALSGGGAVVVPVPLRLISAVGLEDELLAMVI